MLKKFFELKHKEKNIKCEFCGKVVDVKHYSKKYHRVHLTCGHYINPFRRTPFYKTRIDLKKLWLFLEDFSKTQITCSLAASKLGVSVTSAWKLMNKLRKAIVVNNELGDTIWIDETFFGAPKKNSRRQKITDEEIQKYNELGIPIPKGRKDLSDKKYVVFGIAYGKKNYKLYPSKIRCQGARQLKSEHSKEWRRMWIDLLTPLKGKVKDVIHDGDASLGLIIKSMGFNEYNVKHSKKEFVKIQDDKLISTNIVEGHFGRFKRRFIGNYTWCKEKYLQGYLDEFDWRKTHKNRTFTNFLMMFL